MPTKPVTPWVVRTASQDVVRKSHRLDSGFESDSDTIFMTGLSVNHVPAGRNGGVGNDDVIRILDLGDQICRCLFLV
ncbi:MAG: hypothetical protein UW84_C0056G0008 [Candidatus Collierbacteria bacterium GW2011_GWA2_44_99]|uniref:Uncharacterized protein n=1 Tax=Candidatus Collierbacteria bacterium GW2011_GWA2_44_99 TaxID=1618380 RepID=A0A0G1KM02_9BACT|nr:MAG: hypothetical protein UW84_C0056G0008 [Candidatus Collierbacteria bacterium GW2011_GWA2_44_99]